MARKCEFSKDGNTLIAAPVGADQTVAFDLMAYPEEIRDRLLWLGLTTRVVNSYNKVSSPEAVLSALTDLDARLKAGEWSARGEGSPRTTKGEVIFAHVSPKDGSALYAEHRDVLRGRAALVVAALSRVKDVPLAKAVKRWTQLDDKTRRALAKAPAVLTAIAEIEAEMSSADGAEDALDAF